MLPLQRVFACATAVFLCVFAVFVGFSKVFRSDFRGLRCLFFGRDTAYAASLFLHRLSSPDGDRPKRCAKSLFEFCAGKGGYGKGDFLCKRSRVRTDDDYGRCFGGVGGEFASDETKGRGYFAGGFAVLCGFGGHDAFASDFGCKNVYVADGAAVAFKSAVRYGFRKNRILPFCGCRALRQGG